MAAIVLTGASAGIGAAAAVELTKQGHRVFATGRSAEKLRAVHDRMMSVAPVGLTPPEPIAADLSVLAEVRGLASRLLDTCPVIDCLANNAGLTTRRRETTPDGYEMTFAVNHLAPFLLTNLLADRVRASDGRVITTSSRLHRVGRIRFDDLQLQRQWRSGRAYAQSKLANVLFTRELAKRLDVAATCFHPGGVKTELNRQAEIDVLALLGPFMRTPERGADTLVWLATATEGRSRATIYYANRKPAKCSVAANNDADAARLWDVSEELVRAAD